MQTQFEHELKLVGGEFVLCADYHDAVRKVEDFLSSISATKIAVMNRPLCEPFLSRHCNSSDPKELEQIDAAILSPELLLADTGSCVFSALTGVDRLLVYIAPISIVIASSAMLRQDLATAWPELKPRLEQETQGEFVVMTGPSRTADIEKILVMGVHGPKRVVVFFFD